jgi:hypothetical protein
VQGIHDTDQRMVNRVSAVVRWASPARAARLVDAPFDSLSPVSARRLPVHPAGGYDLDRVPAIKITGRDVLKMPADRNRALANGPALRRRPRTEEVQHGCRVLQPRPL